MDRQDQLLLVHDAVEDVLGRRVSPETIWRWRVRGVRGPTGEIIRLDAVRCGARWYSTRAAVLEFACRQSQASAGPGATKVTDRPEGLEQALRASHLLDSVPQLPQGECDANG